MKGDMTVTRHVLAVSAVAAILVGPVPVSAQTALPATDDAARSQAFVFERALRGAVELGGQLLAKQALALVPELALSTEEAIVRGVRLTGYGFYFDVQVPGIDSTVMVWDMVARQRAARPASNASRPVSATGTMSAEPLAGAAPTFDPDREYTSNVRAALIDAILDTSGVLTLAPGERLTVVVSGIDRPEPNPLYRSNSRKAILTILGSDLLDLRQGRITRQEAKERIVEERF